MQKENTSGFTLIELSMVLVILAILTAMGLVASMGALESAQRAANERRMDEIESALMTFRLANNRMPCPGQLGLPGGDSQFGKEGTTTNPVSSLDVAGSNCIQAASPSANFYWNSSNSAGVTVEGAVPVRALNLPDDFVRDAWGREYSYAVDAFTTIPNAFASMRPSDNCSLQVEDANHGLRTTGAVYVLLSYGPNGHGGFFSGPTRSSSGSTNADELSNCHCDSAANTLGTPSGGIPYLLNSVPNYVQKDEMVDMGSAAPFDDIVRFKTRWQMQNYDDQYNFAYLGPQIFVGFDQSLGIGVQAMTYQCGELALGTNYPYADAQVAFGPLNQNLFIYSTAASGTCKLFSISGNTVSDLGAAVDSCPADGGTLTMSTNTGVVAMTRAGTPYLQLWKLSGNHLYELNPTAPVSPPLVKQPSMLSITADGVFLALSDGGNTGVYMRRDDGSYLEMGTGALKNLSQPSPLPPGAITGLAFSPNGRYLAIGNSAAVQIWRLPPPSPSPTPSWAPLSGIISIAAPLNVLRFSPDGRYLAAGGGSGGNSYLYIYSIGRKLHPARASGLIHKELGEVLVRR